jgi:hypothetical protein
LDRQVVLYSSPEATQVHAVYSLMSIEMFDRLKKEDSKLLVLKFNQKSVKDCWLRFDHMADRDQFCMEAHLVNNELVFSDDAQWTERECFRRLSPHPRHSSTAPLDASSSHDDCRMLPLARCQATARTLTL